MYSIFRVFFSPKIQKGQIYYHYDESKNPFNKKIRVEVLNYEKGWVQYKHQYSVGEMKRSVFKMIYELDETDFKWGYELDRGENGRRE